MIDGNRAAFPVPGFRQTTDQLMQYPDGGMSIRLYITIEITKSILARDDAAIFNPHDVAQKASLQTEALLEVMV